MAPTKKKSEVRMGRPKKLEDWFKTTVVLQEKELLALDEMALETRRERHLTVPRSELIREAVGLVLESDKLRAEVISRVVSNRPRKATP